MLDTDKIFMMIENAIEVRGDAIYKYTLLDENKKNILANITIQQDGKSMAERETSARATQEYQDYIKGLADAKRNWLKSDAQYKNLVAKMENMRTNEVSIRNAKI